MAWDPQQYALFGSHRGRPFVDLLSRVAATEPAVVVDLGCGDGPLTLSLTERWPGAWVVGVDSSPQMLAAARELDDQRRVEWVETRVEDWDPGSLGAPIDVLVSNAALQWVPGHLDLFSRWVDALAPDGWFAFQVPNNFDAPSHALMREVAARQPRAAELRSPSPASATSSRRRHTCGLWPSWVSTLTSGRRPTSMCSTPKAPSGPRCSSGCVARGSDRRSTSSPVTTSGRRSSTSTPRPSTPPT